MSVHVIETTVDSLGRVVLEHLPFTPGEKVDVVVRSHPRLPEGAAELRGSVVRYDDPLDPVALEDWEIQP